jgi:acyl-CoA dehydrogenase
MSISISDFNFLQLSVQKIATETAEAHASDVDENARFPIETISALKAVKALSAPIPKEFGGLGCNLQQLAQLCSTVSAACGSSGMVLAMHYIKLACIIRHSSKSDFFKSYLQELVSHQYLLASITSEVGTYGDTRSSICALERNEGHFILKKQATTGSYCAHADAILITCRRDSEAPSNEQILVLAKREDIKLTQTTSWDTMGMRGTCSPGFDVEVTGNESQVLPDSFAEIAAQTMVPYSHILWSALWWGIANGAAHKSAAFVRAQARKTPGTLPPNATRLAELNVQLQAVKHNWQSLASEFDEINALSDAKNKLQDLGWALKMNNLKISTSDQAPQIVHKALQILGLQGYKNDSKYSLSREYRDTLSGSLMISNDRVASKSAALLMVYKDT